MVSVVRSVCLPKTTPDKCVTFAVRYVYGQVIKTYIKKRDSNIRNPVDALVDTSDEAREYVATVWRELMSVIEDDGLTE